MTERTNDLDRDVVAALRALAQGDGAGLGVILASVDVLEFTEHLLQWTLALGAQEHGGVEGFDTLLRHYQQSASGC